MALLYMTGFSEYANPSTYYLAGAGIDFLIDATGGRFGGHGLKNTLAGGGEHYEILPDWFNVSAIVGFAYKFDKGGKATNVLVWKDAYTDGTIVAQVELFKNANDVLCFASNGTVLAKGTHPLLPGRYYYIEWKAFIKSHLDTSTPGHPKWVLDACDAHANQIRLDGVLECEVAAGTPVGVEYSNPGGTLTPGTDGIYNVPGTSLTIAYRARCGKLWVMYDQFQLQQHFDDFYAADNTGPTNNDFLGDLGVDTLAANAVGVHDDWDNSGGADKVASVNEVEPDGDASYVSTGTVSFGETYRFPAMRSGSVTIPGVMTQAVMRKTDITPRGVCFLANGGDTSDAPVTPGDSYATFTHVWDTDPGTGVAWLESGVNALDTGVQVIG